MKLKYIGLTFVALTILPLWAATQQRYGADNAVAILNDKLNIPSAGTTTIPQLELFSNKDRLAYDGFEFRKGNQGCSEKNNNGEIFFDVYEAVNNRRVARGILMEEKDYQSAKGRLSLLAERFSAPLECIANSLRNVQGIGDFCIINKNQPIDWAFMIRGNKAIYFYISFQDDVDMVAMARAMDKLILKYVATSDYLPYDGEAEVQRVLELGDEIMRVRNIASGNWVDNCQIKKCPKDIIVSNVVYRVNATPRHPDHGGEFIRGCLYTLEIARKANAEEVASGTMMVAKDVPTAREIAFGLEAQHSSMPARMIANAFDIEIGDEILMFGFPPREEPPNRITAVYRNALISLWGNGDIKAIAANLMKACCPQADFNMLKDLPKGESASPDHSHDKKSTQIYDMGRKKMISCGVPSGEAIPRCRDGLEIPDRISFEGLVYDVVKHRVKTYAREYGFVRDQTRFILRSASTDVKITGTISLAEDVPTARALSLGMANYSCCSLTDFAAKKFNVECDGESMMFADKPSSIRFRDQYLVYRNMIISLRTRCDSDIDLKALASQLIQGMCVSELESNRR